MTKLTTTEMKMEFIKLATATFKFRREGVLTILDPAQITSKTFMLLRIYESIYRTTPLKQVLVKLFGENLNLYSSARDQQRLRSTRVAVTSTKDTAANRCLITNYNRLDFSSGEDFEREDEDEKEMKVWEAGLATAAAPFYFRPFEKAETMKNYVDGALHANLPIQYALEEMANLWPNLDDGTSLDALVSIGTGIQKRELDIPKILEIGGFKQICTNFHNNINTERLWEGLKNSVALSAELRHKIHRLNANIKDDYVALDDYKKMGAMEDMVARQMEEGGAGGPSDLLINIARVADILTASLFFFEPDPLSFADTNFGGSPAAGRYELKGSIRCRLGRNSQELKRLLSIVDGFWQREIHRAALSLDGNNQDLDDGGWTPVRLADNWRNRVRTGGAWFSVDCTICTGDQTEMQQVIAVTLTPPKEEEKHYSYIPLPISGFPISFKELQRKAMST
jgi:predicted acylesterase/phospholipase RssA